MRLFMADFLQSPEPLAPSKRVQLPCAVFFFVAPKTSSIWTCTSSIGFTSLSPRVWFLNITFKIFRGFPTKWMTRWWQLKHESYFHPKIWGKFPFWRRFFQMGGWTNPTFPRQRRGGRVFVSEMKSHKVSLGDLRKWCLGFEITRELWSFVMII